MLWVRILVPAPNPEDVCEDYGRKGCCSRLCNKRRQDKEKGEGRRILL